MKTACIALLLSSICWAGDSLPAAALVAKPVVTHKFMDKENKLLFTGMALSMAADGASTHQFLHRGYPEFNPIVRSMARTTPGNVAYFTGGTLALIGTSALAHHTGHHRIERWIPIVTTIVEVGWAGWNFHLRRVDGPEFQGQNPFLLAVKR